MKKELYASKKYPPSKVAEYLSEIRYFGFDVAPFQSGTGNHYKVVFAATRNPALPTKFYDFDSAFAEALELTKLVPPAAHAAPLRMAA